VCVLVCVCVWMGACGGVLMGVWVCVCGCVWVGVCGWVVCGGYV
jgi:hypothetical protein